MKTLQTIAGNNYVVYSKNGGTVTDASGTLNKTVEAGDFLFIPAAPSDMLMCDDDESVIKQANFKRAALALRLLGGGNNGLPAGYTMVEWLESTGTQFISTLRKWSAHDEISILYEFTDPPNYNVFGAGKQRLAGAGEGVYFDLNSKILFKKVQGTIRTSAFYSFNQARVNEYSQDIINTDWESASNICIFTNADGMYPAKMRLYSYEHKKQNGDNIRLIPALDNTGAPCLCDTLTGTSFYNRWSGDFLYPNMETVATTYSLRRRVYAQMTEHGIRRLYHVPKGCTLSKEEYAEQNGFKLLVETPAPDDGYWAPVWHEHEDCIELEWVETEPPSEELLTEV